MAAHLGDFEYAVLLAVLQLKEDAYAVPLRSLIEERTERNIARGALYTALERLEGKGCLRSVMKDPSDERGGRATADLRRHAEGSRSPPRDARGAPAPLHRARNDPGTTVTPSPPRLAARLLAFAFADPEWRDSVLGDLQRRILIGVRATRPVARPLVVPASGTGPHAAQARRSSAREIPHATAPSRTRARSRGAYSASSGTTSGRPGAACDIIRRSRRRSCLVLAAALAANATIFAMADAMVLRPFRYPGVAARHRPLVDRTRAVLLALVCHVRRLRRLARAGRRRGRSHRGRQVVGSVVHARWPAAAGERVSRHAVDVRDPRRAARSAVGRSPTADERSDANQSPFSATPSGRGSSARAADVIGRTIWLDTRPYRDCRGDARDVHRAIRRRRVGAARVHAGRSRPIARTAG